MFNAFHMDSIGLDFKELFILLALGIIMLLAVSRLVYAIAALAVHGFSFDTFIHYLIYGGIVFYGGMLGVLLACVIFARITHRRIREVMDYFAPSIPLFHLFGRIGCFFAGCCYGVEWPRGVTNVDFPGVKLFPTQLIESGCNLIIFISIMIMQRIRKTDRYSMEIYLVSYAVCRFVVEFFRGDNNRGVWANGLSTSQNIALIIVITVFIECLVRFLRTRKNSISTD